jgi:uncharacterized protein (DUF433 family)
MRSLEEQYTVTERMGEVGIQHRRDGCSGDYKVVMFDRIGTDPGVLGGKPCVKRTRISVEFLLELAASGASKD